MQYLARESERVEQVRKKRVGEMSKEEKKEYRKKCDNGCKVQILEKKLNQSNSECNS